MFVCTLQRVPRDTCLTHGTVLYFNEKGEKRSIKYERVCFLQRRQQESAYALSVGGYVWRHREGPEETSWGLFIWVFFFLFKSHKHQNFPRWCFINSSTTSSKYCLYQISPWLAKFISHERPHTHTSHTWQWSFSQKFSYVTRKDSDESLWRKLCISDSFLLKCMEKRIWCL